MYLSKGESSPSFRFISLIEKRTAAACSGLSLMIYVCISNLRAWVDVLSLQT